MLVFTPGFYTLFKLLGEMLSADFAGEYPLVDAMFVLFVLSHAQPTKASLTPPVAPRSVRILFLREFPASNASSSKPSGAQFPGPPSASAASSTGTSTPTGTNGSSKTLAQALEDAFVPEGIYTALSHIPCFSFMRVSTAFPTSTCHLQSVSALTRVSSSSSARAPGGC